MACQLCIQTPVPSHFSSPRICAFDEQGNVTSDNWNCETMNLLRNLVPEALFDANAKEMDASIRDDNSAGSIGVIHIPDGTQASYCDDEQLRGYIVLTWYKNRSETGSAMVVCDDEKPRILTENMAVDILNARKHQHTCRGQLAAKEGISSHDPIVAGIATLLQNNVNKQDLANGLVHLYNRIPKLRTKLTKDLVCNIIKDQVAPIWIT